MLTTSDEDRDLVAVIKAVATGYLFKDVAQDQLPGAIRAVSVGQSLLFPSLASTLLSEFATIVRVVSAALEPKLTEREFEVLEHVAKGWSNRWVIPRNRLFPRIS